MMAGGEDGIHRQVQRSLLARRHSASGPRALFRLAARELRGRASGAARDRSLRSRLSRWAALALRAQRPLSKFLRHLCPPCDRADQATLNRRAARRHSDLLLMQGHPSAYPAAGRGVDAPPSLRSLRWLRIYHEFSPEPSDVVIFKQRASAFQGTPLFSHLSLLGVQSLIVCGESTSG